MAFHWNFYWYIIEISTGFTIDPTVISLKFPLNSGWISNGLFYLYFIEISTGYPFSFHGNLNWISNGFPLVYHWNFKLFFIEISTGLKWIFIFILLKFLLNFNWICNGSSPGISLIIHDFHWISICIPLKFQLDLQWISIAISLKF